MSQTFGLSKAGIHNGPDTSPSQANTHTHTKVNVANSLTCMFFFKEVESKTRRKLTQTRGERTNLHTQN